jgi:[NiFe] hydrogenase diaphorase moiety small subunit
MSSTFFLDGNEVPFTEGQTIRAAALAAGTYIPHLCFKDGYPAHGSCRVCSVKANGRVVASCTTPARAGEQVESETAELKALRTTVVQLLFTEGNHFCPSCEVSGRCTLQAVGYDLGVTSAHYGQLYPDRPVDASHPEVILDFNRCILCELCVRASADVDKKDVFSLAGRGITKHLIVNAESGRLGDTTFAASDEAAQICPVGVMLRRGRGFAAPIGERRFDHTGIRAESLAAAKHDKETP